MRVVASFVFKSVTAAHVLQLKGGAEHYWSFYYDPLKTEHARSPGLDHAWHGGSSALVRDPADLCLVPQGVVWLSLQGGGATPTHTSVSLPGQHLTSPRPPFLQTQARIHPTPELLPERASEIRAHLRPALWLQAS